MSASDIEYKLNDMGYKISSQEIFPVSQATVEYVNSRYRHAHCFLIGDENLDSLFQSYGHTVTRSEEPVDLVIIGQVQWAHFGEIDIARRLVEAGAEPVAMHKDSTWPDGGITRIGLGPIVAALQSSITRKVTLIGKPETTFFGTALARAGSPPPPRARPRPRRLVCIRLPRLLCDRRVVGLLRGGRRALHDGARLGLLHLLYERVR